MSNALTDEQIGLLLEDLRLSIKLPADWDAGPFAYAFAQRLARVLGSHAGTFSEEERHVVLTVLAYLMAHVHREMEASAAVAELIAKLRKGNGNG